MSLQKKLAILAGFISLIALPISCSSDFMEERLKSVQSGKSSLYCYIGSGYKYISPDKVIDYIEVNGQFHWIFDNGDSSNCYVENNK